MYIYIYIYIYMHAYIHTYIHPYHVHTYIHTCIHAYIYTYTVYTYTYTHTNIVPKDSQRTIYCQDGVHGRNSSSRRLHPRALAPEWPWWVVYIVFFFVISSAYLQRAATPSPLLNGLGGNVCSTFLIFFLQLVENHSALAHERLWWVMYIVL
jgi:hypothetical protein